MHRLVVTRITSGGAAFAWTEAMLALAVLAPRWRPTLAPGARIGIRATVTMRPAYGMPMVLHAG